jgi:hypothetical protein
MRAAGQFGIQRGPHRFVDDAGAGDDHSHHPVVDVADGEPGCDLGQFVA